MSKTKRKYAEAAQYEDTPEQVKHREERNRLRYKLLKEGKVHKGDKKDVAHKKALDKGGSSKQGYFVQSRSGNRSFDRDAKGNLISEISPKERKKKLTK
jgi:YD repeat-containing protein